MRQQNQNPPVLPMKLDSTHSRLFLCAALIVSSLATPVFAADEPKKPEIQWIHGPAKANLKTVAEVNLPQGFQFANDADTRKFLKATGQPSSGNEMGMLLPSDKDWIVFFEYSAEGYVKDDEKDKLDADKILESIKTGNEYANKERKEMGVPPITVVGWEKPPFYNPETHNLEWAIRGESEGEPILNYNTRILGRGGVMSVTLVCDPKELTATLPKFKELLTGYSYKQGQRYAEYKQGDKLAKYGLAALVTGGAVAVAAKTGFLATILLFFKKGFKFIILALIAAGAMLKNGIMRLFGRKDS
jgi:uncharacterized membrane-anchored protein